MKKITLFINLVHIIFILCLPVFAQTYGGGVTDVDGNTYTTVIIGNQEWMASNLRTSHYSNGDPITNVTDNTIWRNLTTGAWSYYNNDNSNDLIYGKLYNWYAVDDIREVCPDGWKMPSDGDLESLVSFLGGTWGAGGKLKEVGVNSWNSPNSGATDQYGFTAVASGLRSNGGVFGDIGNYGYIWSTWAGHPSTRHRWEFRTSQTLFAKFNIGKNDGYSCRCLKKSAPLPVTITEFNALCNNDLIYINWTTETEVNNDYFTIERSIDAVNFEAIGTVNGSGNSNTMINYAWSSDSHVNGTVYYRLKQTDFNGDFKYYKISSVSCELTSGISIYPNPFKNNFTINLSENIVYPITVEVMNYLGKQLYTEVIEKRVTEITLKKQLPVGTFFVKVSSPTTQIIKKIVKIK